MQLGRGGGGGGGGGAGSAGGAGAMLTALAVLLASAGAAAAQERESGEGTASSKLGVYRDDDSTLVVTSLVDGEVAVSSDVTLGTHALVDVVSAASADVVSAATPSFTETRVETGARVEFRGPRELDIAIGIVRSTEADWSSNALHMSVARDFADKNTRLSASWGHVGNRVGRANDPTFEESLTSNTWELGVTQLVNRRTYVVARYTHQRSEGWHASPYRFVRIMNVGTPEIHPGSRSRHAITLRGVRELRPATALDASYRLYRDDWGILSHTATAAIRYAPGEKWDLRVRARYYVQGAARFYRKRYDTVMKYMSADRELSTFWNASAGLKLARRVGSWVADAKIDVIHYEFLEFDPLPSRLALVTSAGVRYAW